MYEAKMEVLRRSTEMAINTLRGIPSHIGKAEYRGSCLSRRRAHGVRASQNVLAMKATGLMVWQHDHLYDVSDAVTYRNSRLQFMAEICIRTSLSR